MATTGGGSGSRRAQPGRRGRISGRVLDPRGRPLAGAAVAIVGGEEHPDIAEITGDDGVYVLGGLGAGRYRVQATASGFRARTVEVGLRPGQSVEIDVELRPEGAAPPGRTPSSPRPKLGRWETAESDGVDDEEEEEQDTAS